MKYFILILLFTVSASAQYNKEASVLIDVSTYADSSLVASLPYRSVVTECAIVADTSCIGVDSALVKFANSQNVLGRLGGFELTGHGSISRPDEYIESKESVYLHLTGGPASGRVRVYVKWIELF
jgi:hypothetical protein